MFFLAFLLKILVYNRDKGFCGFLAVFDDLLINSVLIYSFKRFFVILIIYFLGLQFSWLVESIRILVIFCFFDWVRQTIFCLIDGKSFIDWIVDFRNLFLRLAFLYNRLWIFIFLSIFEVGFCIFTLWHIGIFRMLWMIRKWPISGFFRYFAFEVSSQARTNLHVPNID